MFGLKKSRQDRPDSLKQGLQGLGLGLGRFTGSQAADTGSSSSTTTTTTTTTSQYFAIHIVDEDTNRGIPLVFMRTNFKTVQVTDSAGYIAFHEPGLMTGAALWVVVSSYGYESPNEFRGLTDGMRIYPKPGKETTIKLKRTQIAERLYRITGYGIYRDSMMLGKPVPIKKPLLNAQVSGSDTVQCAEFRGKLLWMWQDTDSMQAGLGNFHMTAATTDLPTHLDPERGLNFQYLTEDGSPDSFARPIVEFRVNSCSGQPCPIWVDGLTVVRDAQRNERLIGRYVAANNLSCVEEGLVLWNDATQTLQRLERFPECSVQPAPAGHAIYVRDNGVRYAFYGNNTRVKADFISASNSRQYEALTCLSQDGSQANRDKHGKLIWTWVKGAKPVNHDTMNKTIEAGLIRPEEAPYRLFDVDSGNKIVAAQVAIAWNPYLRLWVNIIQQKWGDSLLGETWFSTAHSPVGPWEAAIKLDTHSMNRDGYKNNTNDFYNPVQHYELMQHGGKVIYYTATYVNTFSGNPMWTPYYNYNNIMYRLNLSDPRLALPEPPSALWAMQHDE